MGNRVWQKWMHPQGVAIATTVQFLAFLESRNFWPFVKQCKPTRSARLSRAKHYSSPNFQIWLRAPLQLLAQGVAYLSSGSQAKTGLGRETTFTTSWEVLNWSLSLKMYHTDFRLVL